MNYPSISVFIWRWNVFFCFFFLSHFDSFQYPHRGNLLLVRATETRQALWKQNLWQGKHSPSTTQVTPWGKVVEMKKRQPLVSHSDSTHDPWLSVTFRSLVPLGRSFPASLRSASGHICLAPLSSWFYKHLAFEQSNEFGVSVPFRACLSHFTLRDTKLDLLQLVVKRNSIYWRVIEDYYLIVLPYSHIAVDGREFRSYSFLQTAVKPLISSPRQAIY